ncbi:hypothetical protein [Planctomycetes bacterium Poly30]
MHTSFLPGLLASLALTATVSAQTTLAANTIADNGGGASWGLFFDVTAETGALSITHLRTASTAGVGAGVEFDVYTIPGTGLGGDLTTGPGSSLTGWNSVGHAIGIQGAVAQGISELIDIPDVPVPAGQTVGVCLVFTVSGPRYFGTGANPYQTFTDGALTLTTGESRTVPFTPTGLLFSSRGLTGELVYDGGTIGTSYCGPAVLNSTGASGTISADGSTSVSDNDLTLMGSNLPNFSFCFFIVSRTQGFASMPGGSFGNLCLTGAVGRYVGPGQIQNSGSTGSVSLGIDLAAIPQPNGSIAAVPGDVFNFQVWYRDALGGTAGSNFTDGLQVTFQ